MYLDFITQKLKKRELTWLFKRALQYLLIHTSYMVKRPLCGPILGTFFVTYRCNYRCKMCELPLRKGEFEKDGMKELQTAEMKGILKSLSELGVSGIGFTGGEPLLRNDIFDLLSYAKELKLITHLNTNGFFINNETAEKILLTGVDSINISLDGAKAETHDKIRGVSGAFDKVMFAVKTVVTLRKKRADNIRLKVVCVLDETNIDEVPDLIALSKDIGTDCVEFIPQQPFFSDSKLKNNGFSEKFLNKVSDVVEYLLELKEKGVKIENSHKHLKMFLNSFKGERLPIRCFAGFNSFAVDCYGWFYPCMPWINWAKPVGNIKEKPLKEFWYSKEYNKKRKIVADCEDCYLNCQAELNLLFS